MTAILARATRLVVPAIFILVSGRYFLVFLADPGSFGFDGRMYAAAARAFLEGRNPWREEFYGSYYAAPPPTLVPFIPFAYLPEEAVAVAWVGLNMFLAAMVLRRVGREVWWMAFPPLFLACMLGSVEVLMVAILVIGGRWSGLAALLKPYAIFPLLGERRWRAIVIAGMVALASLLVLPWSTFLADLQWIASRLAAQRGPGIVNAWGDPVLMAISVVALASLGYRRGLWLAVPVLWPGSLPHYASMTVPVITVVIAAIWSLPIPGAIVAGVVIGAIVERRDVIGRLMGQVGRRLPTPSSSAVR